MNVRPLLFCFALAAAGQEPSYFPLQTGNQWVYRQTTGFVQAEPRIVEVRAERDIDGIRYFEITGFPERTPLLVRHDGARLVLFDSDSRTERPWADFGAALNEPFPAGFDNCSPAAAITSRELEVKIPIGTFRNGLRLLYRQRCADAGITEEIFLPGIGLAKRVYDNIAGAQTFELAYARVAGFTVYTGPEHGFHLTLDRFTYERNSLITARLTLRNATPAPLALVFPSGQDFEIVIRNGRGDTVWRWSDGKAFTLALRPLDFAGERHWVEPIRLDLPAGTYTATASLAVMDKKYESTLPFAVVPAR